MIDVDKLPGPFEIELPEIYQIELSSLCNEDCIMCSRKKMKRKKKLGFMPFDLIKKMIDEGDFEGSYFVELQFAGEPLMHPEFNSIVSFLRSNLKGIILGLSTNGMLIDECLDGLGQLDYITVSVDSLTDYSEIRKGGDIDVLVRNIDMLLANVDLEKTAVDLQVVEMGEWEKQVGKIKWNWERPGVRVRSIPDCFLTMFDEPSRIPVKNVPCLNPWLSVSVHSDGNVVPCCFCFGDEIILGSLYENSLRDIWGNSPILIKLRRSHSKDSSADFPYMQIGRLCLPSVCGRCYMRSPVLLHWSFFTDVIRKLGKYNRF